MDYRQVGNSDLYISAITFGAWAAGGWMWGGTERSDAVNAIKASYDLGVTSIDTAPIYGQGTSEEIVGEAIKNIPRDKVQILTKYGMRWDVAKGDFGFKSQDNAGHPIDVYKYSGKDSIIKECEDSLKRLGTDYIDLYQMHWPDKTTPIEESMEAVLRLIEQGKVRQAGVSNYTVEQMQQAETVLSLVANQVPFSMLNQSINETLVPYCLAHKKGILAYSPMERGLLTGKIKPGHQFAEGDHRAGYRFFKEQNIVQTDEFLDKLKPLADEKKASLSQLVIRWTIEQPGITAALVGARNAEQAIQNAQAINLTLSSDELEFINYNLQALELV
ncbi:aldo/keto reductase [Spirosoma endophyticum]|uniref:Predicted oxidoreductase n=1 Tax=Spirosoma endophyticum TaxID=662367 RepID=A0A1I1P6H9_9BACT|nr:aldo/keto reductase [Spirosoma endophyticum]SFD05325.1 Predicted oxidoreductase [Spirosoma endophyticum]